MSCITRRGIGTGHPSAAMGLAVVAVQRKAGNGDWFTIPSGASVRPNEPIRITYSGFGLPFMSTQLNISIINGSGSTVFGPVQDTVFFGKGEVFTTAPPATVREAFSAIVIRSGVGDDLGSAFAFYVDPQATVPPAEPPPGNDSDGDGGAFGKFTPWVIVAVVLVVLVVFSPAINRGIAAVLPSRRD